MLGGISQIHTNSVDTAKGLYTMAEHIPTFWGVGLGPNPLKMLSATTDVLLNGADLKQRFASVLDSNLSGQQDAKFWQGAFGSILQPMQQSWNAGRPAEAIGQGMFEIGSLFLGGGGTAGKAGKLTTAARAARVLENAEDFSQLGRAGRVAGAMDNLGGLGGMLQRGRGALGGMFDNAGGLLQRGRGAVGGIFDNIVGVPQKFLQGGKGLLGKAGGVFDNIVGLPQKFWQGGKGLLDTGLQQLDDLGDLLFGPRHPDFAIAGGGSLPTNKPPKNTMAMSNTPDVPGGKPGKSTPGGVPETPGNEPTRTPAKPPKGDRPEIPKFKENPQGVAIPGKDEARARAAQIRRESRKPGYVPTEEDAFYVLADAHNRGRFQFGNKLTAEFDPRTGRWTIGEAKGVPQDLSMQLQNWKSRTETRVQAGEINRNAWEVGNCSEVNTLNNSTRGNISNWDGKVMYDFEVRDVKVRSGQPREKRFFAKPPCSYCRTLQEQGIRFPQHERTGV
jgi:hypothetical protein